MGQTTGYQNTAKEWHWYSGKRDFLPEGCVNFAFWQVKLGGTGVYWPRYHDQVDRIQCHHSDYLVRFLRLPGKFCGLEKR